jgi:hypothetical protein
LRASFADWARIAFMLAGWLLGLSILIARAMSGASLTQVNVMLLALALVVWGLMLYRDVSRTFFSTRGNQHLSDDSERVREMLVASAQSSESWVCTHCGEPTPTDYGACVHCGQPAGRLR